MKTFLLSAAVLLAAAVWAKDTLQVQAVSTHSVTHDDQGQRAVLDKGILGAHSVTRQVESFNLDAVINGEHVLLVCDDPKGCEAPAVGTYEGERMRSALVLTRPAGSAGCTGQITRKRPGPDRSARSSSRSMICAYDASILPARSASQTRKSELGQASSAHSGCRY